MADRADRGELAPPPHPAAEGRFFNRELSWLTFNRRVLAEASNPDYPLLEQLRFLSISGSNLDEFMMVRVAGLAGQVRRRIEETSIDGMTPSQQLAAIREAVIELEQAQQGVWRELRTRLLDAGIGIVGTDQLPAAQNRWLKDYFLEHVMPVLTPQAIDPAHPFPFVANQGMGILLSLTRSADASPVMEMVLIPPALHRFIRLPGDEAAYIGIEDLICRHAELIFPGFRIDGHGVFRVLRDSDIEVEEDAEDLVRYYRTAIQRRRRGSVILLQLQGEFDPAAEQLLRNQLGLDQAMVMKTDGLIGVAGLAAIVEEDRPDLKFEAYSPRYPERILEHDGDCFAAIREKDIIIHHPYESFEVVVDFLRQAASDPDVVAIKQTLYRAGKQSAVIAALIAAAEAGKSVTAVVELKARFDEEQNLLWASELERAGVQVIYGFVDWKTHAKVSLVVRREGNSYRTYCHFGTGNYHPVTARIYTDLSFFTADPKMGRDAGRLFNFVTGYVEPKITEMLAIAPLGMRSRLYECIDREIEQCPRRQARRDLGQAQFADRSRFDRPALRRQLRRRAGKPGGAGHMLPETRRSRIVGKHRSQIDHRALSGAQPHLGFCLRCTFAQPQCRSLHHLRRCHEPQFRSPGRGVGADRQPHGARSGARSGDDGKPARQRTKLAAGRGRNLAPGRTGREFVQSPSLFHDQSLAFRARRGFGARAQGAQACAAARSQLNGACRCAGLVAGRTAACMIRAPSSTSDRTPFAW